jgi:acetyltransferase-like isoleucine patch superfamily enzyme
LNHNFRNATGEAMLEWDSPEITRLKYLNEIAFDRYLRGDLKAQDLFSNEKNNGAARSLQVGDGLIGEYFSNVTLSPNIAIGSHVSMVAHGGITIGRNVDIGNNSQLLTVFHSLHPEQRLPIRTSPIVIEDNVTIGNDVILVSSRRNGRPLVIGAGSEILPGSVVIHDVEKGSVVSGRPAARVSSDFTLNASVKETPKSFTRVDSHEVAKQIFGQGVEAGVPVYHSGEGTVKAEGFYLVNRGSRLSVDGDLSVGRDVLIGPSVTISVERGSSLRINPNVWVGAGAMITAAQGRNLSIGAGSIIAAGATITEDVAASSLMTATNILKRRLTDEADYDHSIPKHWLDVSYCVRDMDAVSRAKQALATEACSPEKLKDMTRAAYRDLDKGPLGACPKLAFNPF